MKIYSAFEFRLSKIKFCRFLYLLLNHFNLLSMLPRHYQRLYSHRRSPSVRRLMVAMHAGKRTVWLLALMGVGVKERKAPANRLSARRPYKARPPMHAWCLSFFEKNTSTHACNYTPRQPYSYPWPCMYKVGLASTTTGDRYWGPPPCDPFEYSLSPTGYSSFLLIRAVPVPQQLSSI